MIRAFLLDISRGSVPTLDTWSRLVAALRSSQAQALCLYIEPHAIELPDHPALSAGYPALSLAGVREVAGLCAQAGIELIPAVQSLGHMRRLLEVPAYAHLVYDRRSQWSVRPCLETWELLDEIITPICQAAPGAWLHVCCDEPHDLLPVSRWTNAIAHGIIAGSIPPVEPYRADLYLHHIDRLHALCRRLDRKVILWADPLLHWPWMLAHVPTDVRLAAWVYQPLPETDWIALLASHGHKVWTAASCHAEHDGTPDVERARVNLACLHAAGRTVDAEGALLCWWGDAGVPFDLGSVRPLLDALKKPGRVPRGVPDRAQRTRLYAAFEHVYDRALARGDDEQARQYVCLDALEAVCDRSVSSSPS